MGTTNRTALLTKTHRVLKQQYTPVAPVSDRPLLEHLLFALVLENAQFDVAEKIYTHLSKSFFDWNEVRVSTVTELAEVAKALPDPVAAASNVKRVLQGVFESTYSFDLEVVKKHNISAAMKQLERLGGTTPFSLAYVTQAALGGHSIPLDRGALDVLRVLGIINDGEAESGKVSGMERVIPKNKGIEFGSLLHQVAAEYVANPFSAPLRKILLSINPEAKDRFPKRGAKKEEPREAAHPAGHHAGKSVADQSAKKHAPDGKARHAVERGTGEKTAGKGAGEKEPEKGADKAAAKSGAKTPEKSTGKTAAEKAAAGKAGVKKPAPGKHPEPKHAEVKHRAIAKPHPAAKPKSASKQLSKRKPR